jgi:competence protein ComEC
MLPLFWIALAFTAGILLAHYITGSIWLWAVCCFCCLILIIISRIYSRKFIVMKRLQNLLHVSPSVLLLFISLGGLRTALAQPVWSIGNLAWYNDRGSYTLVTLVDQIPDRREDATYLHVSARELYNPGTMTYRRIQGVALVRVDAGAPWQLGDLLRFSASPQTPSANEDFSYQAYLQRQGVYTIIYHPTSIKRIASGQASGFTTALAWLQQKASQSIFTIFPQPESGLLAGILLGNDNDLPVATKQAYQDTGTAHIIAISGFNMAILAALFLALFTRILNRYWAAILSALALITYALFVGGSPSVVRAAIMAIMAFFGHLIGRKGGSMNALGVAAGSMLVVNPLLLWDASFQLSFAATAGLVLFATPMKDWLEGFFTRHSSEETAAHLTGPVSEYFLFSVAAQITTLPVIAIQFKRLSLTSLLANPLVLPVQSAILVAGGVATVAGMVLPVLGRGLALFVWPLVAYSNRMVEWLDQIPNGVLTITGNLAIWISLVGILIILMAVIMINWKNLFKRIKFVYLFIALAVIASLIWSIALRQPDGLFHLSMLGAEGGTALYLQSPDGETLLIDPAGSPDTLASQISQTISPWNFHLDAALLTRRDTVDALTSLNARLPLKMAVLTPAVYQVTDDQSALVLPEGMQIQKLVEDETIRFDHDLMIQTLTDDADHTALLISYGQTRILIPNGGDPEMIRSAIGQSSGLSALILNEDDVANLPTDMWQNFGAQIILWNSADVAPDPQWLGLDTRETLILNSDGNKFWLNQWARTSP